MTTGTTTALSANPDPATYDSATTLTATVTPAIVGGAMTGSVTFYRGGTSLGSASVSWNSSTDTGTATLSTSGLSWGPNSLTAVYGGDSTYHSSSSSAVTVNAGAATTTTVSSSSNPSTYGNSVSFVATVDQPDWSDGEWMSGSVAFYDGATLLGSVSLSYSSKSSVGTAVYSTSALSAGAHSITAVYSGNTYFAASTSSGLTQSVNARSLSVTGITAGNKTYDGTTIATIDTSGLRALVGVLSGDSVSLNASAVLATFSNKNDGSSKTVNVSGLTLSGADAANYTLTQPTTTANISAAALTITANDQTMGFGSAVPALTVSYSGFVGGDNSSILTAEPTLSTSATDTSDVGTYTIAVSGASAANYTITYVDGTLAITQASSATAVTSSENPSAEGDSVTFTATVEPAQTMPSGAASPTGSVRFLRRGNASRQRRSQRRHGDDYHHRFERGRPSRQRRLRRRREL